MKNKRSCFFPVFFFFTLRVCSLRRFKSKKVPSCIKIDTVSKFSTKNFFARILIKISQTSFFIIRYIFLTSYPFWKKKFVEIFLSRKFLRAYNFQWVENLLFFTNVLFHDYEYFLNLLSILKKKIIRNFPSNVFGINRL